MIARYDLSYVRFPLCMSAFFLIVYITSTASTAQNKSEICKFLSILLLDIVSKVRDISIAIFFREVLVKSNVCARLLMLD